MSPHETVSGERDSVPIEDPVPRVEDVDAGVRPVEGTEPRPRPDPLDPRVDEVDAAGRAAALDEQQVEGRHIVRGSSWFIASVITGAGLSFLFWALATKVATQYEVGVATKLWVNLQFMNYVTSMGLPVAVAKYGSMRRRTFSSLFTWALVYTAFTSLAGATLFALVAPAYVSGEVLDSLKQWGAPFGFLIFFLLTAGMAFSLLVEVRLVTMRKWRWVYGRVIAVSLVRLPLLFVPSISHNPMGLLLLIAGTPALSGFVGVLAIRYSTPRADRGRLFPIPPEVLPALRYASVNYVGMLAAQGPQFVLPVVVNVGPEQFAPFFLAWSITIVVFLIPHTIGQVVLSEGSRNTDHIGHQVKVGLRLSLLLMMGATLAVVVGSSLVTRVLGQSYALTAELLVVLVSAGIPWAVTSMCLAKARVEGNHLRTVVITSGFALFTLIPAAEMSSRSGPHGAANAWLLGNIAAAVLALVVTRWVKASPRSHLLASTPLTTPG